MANKKPKAENIPLVETYNHVHKGAIQVTTVAVRIDYHYGTISLIDVTKFDRDHGNNAIAKQWIFANRELEYMQGWLDIMDAMKSAVKDATEKLKAFNKSLQNVEA